VAGELPRYESTDILCNVAARLLMRNYKRYHG